MLKKDKKAYKKELARLNLPLRQEGSGCVRPPITDQTFVPEVYISEKKSEKV